MKRRANISYLDDNGVEKYHEVIIIKRDESGVEFYFENNPGHTFFIPMHRVLKIKFLEEEENG